MDKLNSLINNMPHIFLSQKNNVINYNLEDEQFNNELFQSLIKPKINNFQNNIQEINNISSKLTNNIVPTLNVSTTQNNIAGSVMASYNSTSQLKNDSLNGSIISSPSIQIEASSNYQFLKFPKTVRQVDSDIQQHNYLFIDHISEDQYQQQIPNVELNSSNKDNDLEQFFTQKQTEFNQSLFNRDDAKNHQDQTHQFLMKVVREQLDSMISKSEKLQQEHLENEQQVKEMELLAEKSQKELQEILFERRAKILIDKVDATLKYKLKYDYLNNYENPYKYDIDPEQLKVVEEVNQNLERMYQDNSQLMHEVSLLMLEHQQQNEENNLSNYQDEFLQSFEIKNQNNFDFQKNTIKNKKQNKKVLTKFILDQEKFKPKLAPEKPKPKPVKQPESLKQKISVNFRQLQQQK